MQASGQQEEVKYKLITNFKRTIILLKYTGKQQKKMENKEYKKNA